MASMMTVGDLISRVRRFVWEEDLSEAPWWVQTGRRVLQHAGVLIRDYFSGTLNLHAMSLVYTTLLALIPALAIVFSVLKGFGVDRELEIFLADFLAPLGEQGAEIQTTIIDFVEQVNIGVLGTVGLAVLVWTGISLIQKVEAAFNEIWQVRRLRPLARRFSDFVSVLFVGPILMVTAMGLMASVAGAAVADGIGGEAVEVVVNEVARLAPYFLVVAAFTVIYMIIPNTRVKFIPALTGAIVAGIAWNFAGWAFATFVVTSARYAVIYSAFASLVVFMIWMYVGWLILLAGAGIAFYQQNPAYLTRSTVFRLSIAARERLTLDIGYLVASSFYRGERPWSAERLARVMHLPLPPVERVIAFLQDGGILLESAEDPPGLLPARPLERISVNEMLNVVRDGSEGMATFAVHTAKIEQDQSSRVKPLLERLDLARKEALDGLTLRDLAVEPLTGDASSASAPRVAASSD